MELVHPCILQMSVCRYVGLGSRLILQPVPDLRRAPGSREEHPGDWLGYLSFHSVNDGVTGVFLIEIDWLTELYESFWLNKYGNPYNYCDLQLPFEGTSQCLPWASYFWVPIYGMRSIWGPGSMATHPEPQYLSFLDHVLGTQDPRISWSNCPYDYLSQIPYCVGGRFNACVHIFKLLYSLIFSFLKKVSN